MILAAALAVLTAGLPLYAQTMTESHVLTRLWKQYDEAVKADRPQKEAEVLSQIKQEALRQHLPLDFYDAATQYVRTGQRRDWKQRDALREALRQEVEAFDMPLITFHWMNEWTDASGDELLAYVLAHPDGFEGRHPALYRSVDGYLDGDLKPFIRNDREYAFWRLLLNYHSGFDAAFPALEKEVEGLYPNQAALEFYAIGRQNRTPEQEKADYEALAARYEGRAVAVFPRAELLRIQWETLNKNHGGSADYKALYEEAQALEKERKAFRDEEATLVKGCDYPATLCEMLTAKDLNVCIQDNSIRVVLQNLSRADVSLRQGKNVLQSWQLDNPVGSFYAADTLSVPLPPLADGEYSVEATSGTCSAKMPYVQYTLSLATRTDSRGRCVYVADYKTGVPLRSVTLLLMKRDKEVGRSTLKLDGFTPLPAAFDKTLDAASRNAYYQLVAVSGERKSRSAGVQNSFSPVRTDSRLRCNIYRDRGAYNPGDTLHFKAVVFDGDPAGGLQTVAGKTVEVRLYDSEKNLLSTQQLTTNDFGSVAGSFVLPKGLRNGRYSLRVDELATDDFRVDEFVLPSFDLRFDPVTRLYLCGDEVPVSGMLSSFSGHHLDGVRLNARVKLYGKTIDEQEVPVGADNRFRFSFPARESGYYQLVLTATDATGETQEFYTDRYIGSELSVDASVPGAVDADLLLVDKEDGWYGRVAKPKFIVTDRNVQLKLQARDQNGTPVPLPVQYRISTLDGKPIASGEVPSAELFTLQLPGTGHYKMELKTSARRADGSFAEAEKEVRIVVQLPEDRKLAAGVERLFLPGESSIGPGKAIQARIGSGEGDAHAVVTLYGKDRKVLVHKTLHASDKQMETLSFPYKDSWPDAVLLQVFYFLNGESVSYNQLYRREKDRYSLPLHFSRFQDSAHPGTQYSLTLQTTPDAEVLVAAWDKSLDAVARNNWPTVNLREVSVEGVDVISSCGYVTEQWGQPDVLPFQTKRVANGVMAAAMTEEADSVKETAVGVDDVPVRSVFSTALSFQPQLRPADDGELEVNFRTSDKLSTYYIRAYAHDRRMHNAVTEQELVVSLPVKVSFQEPRHLYAGDVYDAAVTVSSLADEDLSGVLFLEADGRMQQLPVTIPAGTTQSRSFRVQAAEAGELTLKAGFKGADFADAVQVTVPVSAAAQTLTESHSAVLPDGADREALLTELQGRFVNVPASAATLREITVLDMVRDAIPAHVDPQGKDVLSLSEAWYIRLMASRLDGSEPDADALLEKILACRNNDGGFGWFEGMDASPVITAVLLERFARLRDSGFPIPSTEASVRYLDHAQFSTDRPRWYGGLSDGQYLRVRALYAAVPFTLEPVGAEGKKRMTAFRKWAKSYLTPGADRGLQGQILAKARRILTLKELMQRDGGRDLAKAFGVRLATESKLQKSLKADVSSLLEYAVPHRDGGWYYPNAVLPWRGLLESEAYAHSLLCDLLGAVSSEGLTATRTEQERAATIADGIRLWLMLQKETQQWETEPAFIDALTSILDGSDAVLNTRVLALSATYEAPFRDIQAAGNGFTLERRFYKETDGDRMEIQPGEPVQMGDKIVAEYRIWNGENRSFVKLTAGREASLAPVQQLSGPVGQGCIVPRRNGVSFGFVPQGYRNVKATVTEYYFDSYPEEDTSLSEAFFVVRAGTFQAPVTVIESLYAPHYRANSAYRLPLVSL